MQRITSICPYCGCGCKLDYLVENGRIVDVKPSEKDKVSEGNPCVKGLTVHETVGKGRLKLPMIRINGDLKEVTWKEAFDHIYKRIKNLSPEEVFLTMSGKITNEDNYVTQKFGRVCLETSNIDSCCGRLCHASTVQAMNNCFGASNLTRMRNLEDIDTLLIIGSNPASNYPVFFNKLIEKKESINIISVQSIVNQTSELGDIQVTIEPGTEVVLLNGLINSVITSKAYKGDIEKVDGFKVMREVAKDYPKRYVCGECGIDEEKFDELAKTIKNSECLGIFHGMGFTQHVNSIENVHSLLNLMILKDGRVLTLRGEINVQGVGDIGCLPGMLPSGSLSTLEKLEKFWNCKLSQEKGKNIMEALLLSPVKAAIIVGFNPAQSMPNLKEVHENLKEMFLVCVDSYSNETSKYANVVLPTPLLMERNGTITNGERRVRKVNKVKEPFGNSNPEWKIFKEFSKWFGKKDLFEYKNPEEIFEEITEVVPDYSKLNKVFKDGKDMFAKQKIKYKRFQPESFEGVDIARSEKYPFLLTTFRSKYQFLTGEMSSKSETLNKMSDKPCFYLNPEDAKSLKVENGDLIKVTSSVSSIQGKVKIDESIPKGIVASRFHSDKLLINKLTPTQFDEESFIPNYKAIGVNVEKI